MCSLHLTHPWGAVGSHSAAPRDRLQILASTSVKGTDWKKTCIHVSVLLSSWCCRLKCESLSCNSFICWSKRTNLTLSTPFKILPPATPPFKSSTSQPGLFTSKDLMTETQTTLMRLHLDRAKLVSASLLMIRSKNWQCDDLCVFSPMSLGSEVKSLTGTGIFFTMYSQTTSMLYFSCAEIGMMGAPSATVPEEKHDTKHHVTLTRHSGTHKVTWRITSLKKHMNQHKRQQNIIWCDELDWWLSISTADELEVERLTHTGSVEGGLLRGVRVGVSGQCVWTSPRLSEAFKSI